MNGLYIAASGAASELAGLDTRANNLANIDTVGFKRVLDVVESLTSGSSPYEYASVTGAPMLDMTQGPIKQTGNPLDIAITGPAFLVVDTPNGPAYTRNGQLQIGPNGQLLAAGNPVEGDGGGTITLPSGPVVIGIDGTIDVNGLPAGKLALADPTNSVMTPIGQTLYRPVGGETLPPATAGTSGSSVRQGYLESPSANEIGELVGMMGQARNYEAAMKAVSSIDQNQDQTIQAFTLQA
jgi:flagellar basal body rod protein FlgG